MNDTSKCNWAIEIQHRDGILGSVASYRVGCKLKTVTLTGSYKIIPGRKHGKAIGYPTLNFDLQGYQLPLETGIYAGRVTTHTQEHPAVFHYGPRPMIGDRALSFEAHLLDGRLAQTPTSAVVKLVAYLRDVQTFADEHELKQQITADVVAARRALSERPL